MADLPLLTEINVGIPIGHFVPRPMTLDGWNSLWLELIFMVPSLFEPLDFWCIG